MVENSQHAPAPTGRGVFWAIKEDWNKPVVFGITFVVLTLVIIAPFLYIIDRDQKISFAAAIATLRGRSLQEVPIQRKAVLATRDGIFDWRAVIWEKQGDRIVPLLFRAKVDKSSAFRVTESTVIPYERDRAWELGLYEEIP